MAIMRVYIHHFPPYPPYLMQRDSECNNQRPNNDETKGCLTEGEKRGWACVWCTCCRWYFFQYLAPWQSMLDLTKTKEADCTKVENTVKGQEKKDASFNDWLHDIAFYCSAEVWSRLHLDLVCLFEIVMRSAKVWSSFHSDFVCLFEIVLRSAGVLFKTSFIFSLSR